MDAFTQIIKKLEHFPETALQEVLDFVDFLEWRRMNRQEKDDAWLEKDLSHLGSFEPYDWEPGELEEGCPVEYVEGVLVVKPQGGENIEATS